MPQLDPTWFASQLFWLAISFVLLYVVLSRFVLPPMQGIMALRKQTKESDINQAQSFTADAEKARQAYEQALAESRNNAQQLMNEAVAQHKAKAEAANKAVDQEIDKKLADAMQKIQARKEELLSALTPAAAELTSMIVEKLTQRAPNNEQVDRIIDALAKGRS